MLKLREGTGTLTPACLSLADSHQVPHDDEAEGKGLQIPGKGFWFLVSFWYQNTLDCTFHSLTPDC